MSLSAGYPRNAAVDGPIKRIKPASMAGSNCRHLAAAGGWQTLLVSQGKSALWWATRAPAALACADLGQTAKTTLPMP